jgi:hypothetical protein
MHDQSVIKNMAKFSIFFAHASTSLVSLTRIYYYIAHSTAQEVSKKNIPSAPGEETGEEVF